MSKHTPGPWRLEERIVTALLLAADGRHLANIFQNDESAVEPTRSWANARLIARAPEMAAEIERLTARVRELEKALEWYASDANWLNPEKARAAITKGEREG